MLFVLKSMEIWRPMGASFGWGWSDMSFIIGCVVCAQKIRGRLCKSSSPWKTYCGRNLVCDQPVRGQCPYLVILFVWEFCDEMFRYSSSSSWPMDHTLDLMVCILSFLRRLWSALWIGYYSGRKTSAIQLYLADPHWQCWEHSILHEIWSCEMLSLCGKLIWRRNVVFWLQSSMFCIQKKVVQIPYVNHFVLEELVRIVLRLEQKEETWRQYVGVEGETILLIQYCFSLIRFVNLRSALVFGVRGWRMRLPVGILRKR